MSLLVDQKNGRPIKCLNCMNLKIWPLEWNTQTQHFLPYLLMQSVFLMDSYSSMLIAQSELITLEVKIVKMKLGVLLNGKDSVDNNAVKML